MSSLYMPKAAKSSFYHIFYNMSYPNPLSNVIISNSILSSLSTHPTQHRHLCYAYFMFVLVLYRPNTISRTTLQVLLLFDKILPST